MRGVLFASEARWQSFTALCLALLILAATRSAPAQETFNVEDFFILTPGSEWHYTHTGEPGSSPEDNFTWRVLDIKKDVGGGRMATRLQTLTDETDDNRHMDEDFWYLDPANGDLFFYGIKNAREDGGSISLKAQEIVLSDPLRVGGGEG